MRGQAEDEEGGGGGDHACNHEGGAVARGDAFRGAGTGDDGAKGHSSITKTCGERFGESLRDAVVEGEEEQQEVEEPRGVCEGEQGFHQGGSGFGGRGGVLEGGEGGRWVWHELPLLKKIDAWRWCVSRGRSWGRGGSPEG